MPTTIKLKNSVTTTSVPSSLVQGEVAINITDKKVWVGNAATTPIQLLGGGADGNFTNISVSSVATFGAGTVSAPSITTTGDTNTGIFFPAADTIAFTEGGAESMRINSSGQMGIGTTSPSATLHVTNADLTSALLIGSQSDSLSWGGYFVNGATSSTAGSGMYGKTNAALYFNSQSGYGHIWTINGTERMRIDTSGNLLVGTTSASLNGITSSISRNGGSGFNAINSNAGTATYVNFQLGNANSVNRGGVALLGSAWTTSNITIQDGVYVYSAGNGGLTLASETASPIYFATSSAERMRISSAGDLLVGKTSTSFSTQGTLISPTGQIEIVKSSDRALNINRLTDDGNLVNFYQDSALEGSISVSGNTVSYNGGHLSRWSQWQNQTGKPEVYRGSVLESTNDMCEWNQANEQATKTIVSTTAKSKAVAGVFDMYDTDDKDSPYDFYVAQSGDFVIRIAQGVVVENGDLLESAGDGTARPQTDDICRSSTVAKVTSNYVSTTYADGSYCVPCILMIG
jgi:hypothetical protein